MNTELNLGDLLYRSKGFVEHVGVYAGESNVIHNSPDGDIQLSSLTAFADNKEIKVIAGKTMNNVHLKNRIDATLSDTARYKPFTHNCEQFANALLGHGEGSPQIRGAAFGMAAGIIVGKSSGMANHVLSGCIGAVLGCILVNANRKYDYKLAL